MNIQVTNVLLAQLGSLNCASRDIGFSFFQNGLGESCPTFV